MTGMWPFEGDRAVVFLRVATIGTILIVGVAGLTYFALA